MMNFMQALIFSAPQFSILRRSADRTHSITLVAFAGRNIAVWVAENEKAPANAEASVMKLLAPRPGHEPGTQ